MLAAARSSFCSAVSGACSVYLRDGSPSACALAKKSETHALLLERQVLDDVLLAAAERERRQDLGQDLGEEARLGLLRQLEARPARDGLEVEHLDEGGLVGEDGGEDEGEEGEELVEVVLLRVRAASALRARCRTRWEREETYERRASKEEAELGVEALDRRKVPATGDNVSDGAPEACQRERDTHLLLLFLA